MQVVINVSEARFRDIQRIAEVQLESNHFKTAEQIIANGTQLPKGHGDLIDRRELKKDVYTTTEWNGDVHRIIYEASVDNAPTIIEAESEG
jgi:hypothetical protein